MPSVTILRNVMPASDKVWPELLSALLSANGVVNDHLAWRIDENIGNNTALTTKAMLAGTFQVPADYASGAILDIIWTSTIGSGNAVFDFDARSIADAESLDQATFDEGVTATAAAPTANQRKTTSITLTDAKYAAGETVQFQVGCDGTDGADTLAGARLILDARFRYTA